MPEIQQWLESREKYSTREKRLETKELNISGKNLEGELDLSDFVNLEKLDCSYNQIKTIDLSNCQQLKAFDCSFNKLTSLDLTQSRKLEEVICNDNYLKITCQKTHSVSPNLFEMSMIAFMW